jgi:hypothetical protein
MEKIFYLGHHGRSLSEFGLEEVGEGLRLFAR